MALENKLGLTSSADLAREEERISKKKAVWLFESGTLDKLPVGTFASLKAIHKALFEDIYDFAGKLRTVNLAKGNFRFAPLMYLEAALANIEKMPQSTFDEIIEKYDAADCSMAGISRLQMLAATMTPAAKPVRALCTRSPIFFRKKKTQAEPSTVPRNGIRTPLIISIFIFPPANCRFPLRSHRQWKPCHL